MFPSKDNPDTSAAAQGINDLPSCAVDPVGALKTLFVDLTMVPRIDRGQKPVQRPVFRKTHGVAAGTFRMNADVPPEFKVGIFALNELPMMARFSTDDSPFNPDAKATIGIGIKLIGVPGPKILHPDAATCDFVMQNHPVFFVDNAPDMCEISRDSNAFLATHPASAQILRDMEKVESSVLTAIYWGILPHKLGDDRVVKYKLTPRSALGTLQNGAPPQNYLYLDFKDRLLHNEAVFDFHLQLQKDPGTMPIDEATVLWDETASPPIHVAMLTFPAQNIDAQAVFGENFATSIWQTLPVHQPLGTIADARKVVYAASAELRRTKNQMPLEEPAALPAPQTPAPALDTIVRAAICPSIGVARVGNSTKSGKEGFFIGPEIPEAPTLPLGGYKDAMGALKRQAARFRIYGYNARNEVVAELNADNAAIDWQVHLANKKSAWYQFQHALDIPLASEPGAKPSRRRNATVLGADRGKLVIDPGPRTIHGRDTSGSNYQFSNGKFFELVVPLGELQTDASGRLIVLGGAGVSQSIDGTPAARDEFANNDKWHDDTSDGPVDARVVLNGREVPVEGAWVVVGPPNYAPAINTVRSMHDLLLDVMVDAGFVQAPARVSFQKHIRPIFEHLSNLQWVNGGFASLFGANAPFDVTEILLRLADKSAANREFRIMILHQFRDPLSHPNNLGKYLWPQMYGDAIDSLPFPPTPEPDSSVARPLSLASISKLQLQWLTKWANGDFDSDTPTPRPRALAEVPLQHQPDILTEAALSYCLADAFHPGCELTWPMRHRLLYSSAFRIRRQSAGFVEPDFGDILTPAVAVSVTGPLNASGPGDLTRWMAVPWQTDTASCLGGYEGFFDTYPKSLPTFWPARVPNFVLTHDTFESKVMKGPSLEARLSAFNERRDWYRGFTGTDDNNQMIKDYDKLGIVEERDGPTDVPGVPKRVWVESKPALPEPAAGPTASAASGVSPTLPSRYRIRKFGPPGQ